MKVTIEYKTGEIELTKELFKAFTKRENDLIESKNSIADKEELKEVDRLIGINKISLNYYKNKLEKLEVN